MTSSHFLSKPITKHIQTMNFNLSNTIKSLILLAIVFMVFLGGCLHQGSFEQGCLRLCDGLEKRQRPSRHTPEKVLEVVRKWISESSQ